MKRIHTLLASAVVAILIVGCADPVGSPGDGAAMVSEKTAILQEGLAGYSGTDDTTIYADETDWTASGIIGDAPTANGMTSRYDPNKTPRYRAIALVRFDVSGLTSNMLSSSETCESNIEVMKATVELKGRIGPSTALTYFNPLDLAAPAWNEDGANWTEASSGVDWTGGTNVPLIQDLQTGVSDARQGWGNSSIDQSVYFNLATQVVKEWICDGSQNQGFAIRNIIGVSEFYTSEFSVVSERPKLVLVLQKI